MKSILKSAASLLLGSAFIASSASAVTTSNGDLLIGFYEVVGGTVQPNTYIFNLGSANLYRENTLINVPVSSINTTLTSSNIGADLVSVFGSDWAESGTVYWTIFGGADQTTVGDLNGDVARTSYISISGSGSSSPTISASPRGTVSNSISAIRRGADGAGTAGVNPHGAIIPTAGNVSLDEYFPPTNSAQLGIGSELRGVFGPGTEGANEGALDIYRYVNSASEGDLTSGLGNGNATLGNGQYIGTIVIDGAGNLSVVPEPSAVVLGAIGALAGLSRRSRKSNNA